MKWASPFWPYGLSTIISNCREWGGRNGMFCISKKDIMWGYLWNLHTFLAGGKKC